MIDFMVNIKNKKNMIKCNIKTLMATSVLCVFFNGVLIYGTENDDDNDTQKNDNNNNNNVKSLTIENQLSEDDFSMFKKCDDILEDYEDKIKIMKKKKKIKDNIFLNFEGDISLLFCFNVCNNKPEKVDEYFQEKKEHIDENQVNEDNNKQEPIQIQNQANLFSPTNSQNNDDEQ